MFSPDSFRAARWVRTINLVLQAVLFLALFGGLNYLARNHAWRFDLTRQRKFSLSPETLSYIKNLDRPVRIIVSLSPENDNPEVKGLLDEYAHATEDNPAGRITPEFVDVYQNRRRAEDLGIDQTGLVVLLSGGKRRSLSVDELYRIKDKERIAFQGEQALTAAVLEVSSPVRKKIYFVTGHGELQPGDSDAARGLSLVRDQLRVRNFDVDTVELTIARGVPADASLLVIVSPSLQSSFTAREQEMLRQYLGTRAGRVILFLPPGKSIDRFGIADLLFDWGILVDDDVVVDPDPASVTEDLDLMISAYDPTHPVTQTVLNNRMSIRFGAVRTVRPDPGRSPASGLTIVPVAGTSKTAWGETNYLRPPPVLDANDIRPVRGIAPRDQLGVVVASERVSVRDNLPFSVPGGRIIVFGSGDLISNQRMANNGNLAVFLGAVNWAVDRDRQLNIPPRPIERFSLALSAGEFARLRYALLLGLPGGTLLLGLIVYWTRRV